MPLDLPTVRGSNAQPLTLEDLRQLVAATEQLPGDLVVRANMAMRADTMHPKGGCLILLTVDTPVTAPGPSSSGKRRG